MPWPRSELTIQAPNEFGLDLKVPWLQLLVRKRFIRVAENEVGYIGRWTRRPGTYNISPKIGLATNEDRAIDLSCRACGVGAWALGLDSRWGASAPLLFSPPTSDITLCSNRKFRNLYPRATHNTPTSNCESFSSCSLV